MRSTFSFSPFVCLGANMGASLNLWAEYFTDPDFIMGLAYGVSVQDVKKKPKTIL
jgi:hypothetical protein